MTAFATDLRAAANTGVPIVAYLMAALSVQSDVATVADPTIPDRKRSAATARLRELGEDRVRELLNV